MRQICAKQIDLFFVILMLAEQIFFHKTYVCFLNLHLQINLHHCDLPAFCSVEYVKWILLQRLSLCLLLSTLHHGCCVAEWVVFLCLQLPSEKKMLHIVWLVFRNIILLFRRCLKVDLPFKRRNVSSDLSMPCSLTVFNAGENKCPDDKN